MKNKFFTVKIMIFLAIIPITLLIFTFFKKSTPTPSNEGDIFLSANFQDVPKTIIKNDTKNVCPNDKALLVSNFVGSLNLPSAEKEKLLNKIEKREFSNSLAKKIETSDSPFFIGGMTTLSALLIVYLQLHGFYGF
jgi:hypothetical protein